MPLGLAGFMSEQDLWPSSTPAAIISLGNRRCGLIAIFQRVNDFPTGSEVNEKSAGRRAS